MTSLYLHASSTSRDVPPCEHRGTEIKSNIAPVHECALLNRELPGTWKVACDAALCRRCASPLTVDHGAAVLREAVKDQAELFYLIPITNGMPEKSIKERFGMSRVEIVKLALEKGISRDRIIEKLKEAYQQRGFPPTEALRVADEAGLFDEVPRSS